MLEGFLGAVDEFTSAMRKAWQPRISGVGDTLRKWKMSWSDGSAVSLSLYRDLQREL